MSLLEKKLDKSVPIPLYFQLKELIISEIQNGTYPPESTIPTEKEFSEIFGISRTTVRQAITELVQEGFLYRVKSKGTFVTQPKINQDFIQYLESFNEQIIRSGRTPSTQLLNFQILEAPESVRIALELEEQSRVFLIHRKRFADKEPIVTIKTYIPYEAFPALADHDFSKESLYEVLAASETSRIHHVKRLVEAQEATEEDAKNLELLPGKPIHHFTSIGYNSSGVPIEYSLARYRGDRNRFEITVFPKNPTQG
jgi:GntR family transcriptional regulator